MMCPNCMGKDYAMYISVQLDTSAPTPRYVCMHGLEVRLPASGTAKSAEPGSGAHGARG